MSQYGEANEIFRNALKDGKLKIDEGEHIVKGSFEDVPKTWMQLFSGKLLMGKSLPHLRQSLTLWLLTFRREHRQAHYGYPVGRSWKNEYSNVCSYC